MPSPSIKTIVLSSLVALPMLAAIPVAAQAQAAVTTTANGGLEQSHGQWRSSKLVGASVYNDGGNSIGTVNEMLLGSDGQVSNVVLSVGGFIGIGTKYVEVPFSKLKFEPSKSNPASNATPANSVSAGAANGHDYSLVLPGVTKESLTSMTAFSY